MAVDLNKVYAVYHNGNLVRFRPDAVIVTRRRQVFSARAEKTSEVQGHVYENHVPTDKITIPVDDLLGEYDKHMELVERENREKAERERVRKEKQELRLSVARLLAEKADIPIVESRRAVGIYVDEHEFSIHNDVLPKLVKFLEGLTAKEKIKLVK